jgi:hypothetical protein
MLNTSIPIGNKFQSKKILFQNMGFSLILYQILLFDMMHSYL